MTDKEQAIEKAIEEYLTELDFELPAPGCLDVEKMTKRIMRIITRTALQGRDEVIEECAEYLDSQAKVFDTRDWMVESSNTTRTLAKELRQLKGAKP